MPLVADPTALQQHPRHPRGRTRRLRRRIQHQRSRCDTLLKRLQARRRSIPSACGWCSTSATASRPATTPPESMAEAGAAHLRRRGVRLRHRDGRADAPQPRRSATDDDGTSAVPARHHAAGLADRDLAHRRGRAEEARRRARASATSTAPPGRRRRSPTSRTGWGRRSRCPRSPSRCGSTGCRCIPAFLLLLWDLVLAARNVGELRAARAAKKVRA